MASINGFQGEQLTSNMLMSRITGKGLTDIEHLMQSIVDILTTPKGSRVMRRDYGSNLYLLLDRQINHKLITDLYAETAEALTTWEPRLRVTQTSIDATGWADGSLILDLYGYYFLEGKPVRLQNVFLDFFKTQRTS